VGMELSWLCYFWVVYNSVEVACQERAGNKPAMTDQKIWRIPRRIPKQTMDFQVGDGS